MARLDPTLRARSQSPDPTPGSAQRMLRKSHGGRSPKPGSPLASHSRHKEGGEVGGGLHGGHCLPANRAMSPLDSRRLDRQKAHMWSVDSESDDDATLTFGSPDEHPGHHGFTHVCRGSSLASAGSGGRSGEVDDETMAYHVELIQDLPGIMARLKGDDVSAVHEAAEDVLELSRGSLAVLEEAVQGGLVSLLPPLLSHPDSAVVESIVLAIINLTNKEAKFGRMLAEEGVMAMLSTVFIRAGEAQPRPHTSLQGNVAAAYLALFAALGSTRAGALLTGQRIIQTLIQLAGPLSGKNYQGRRDALKLLRKLLDRPDVRSQLVSLRGAQVLIETVESEDVEIMEEVAELMLLVVKSPEGVPLLCNMHPGSPTTSPRTGGTGSSLQCDEASQDGDGGHEGERSIGRGEGGEGLGNRGGEERGGAPGVRALVRLLSPDYSPTTQECAASAILRMLTRGMTDCAKVVRETEGLKPALERLQEGGAPKARRQADAILEALTMSH